MFLLKWSTLSNNGSTPRWIALKINVQRAMHSMFVCLFVVTRVYEERKIFAAPYLKRRVEP